MNASNCDHRLVDQFLLELHKPGADDAELKEHLDACLDCQTYFASKVAPREFWEEASDLLRPVDFDYAGRGEYSAGSLGSAPIGELQINEVLKGLAPTDDPQSLGRIGCYEVTGVVGTGAMGVVLKAFDATLDRVVAIKVLASHLASSGTARRRFAREAKAAAAILHPNVIPIHSVSGDGALPFFVMSYIRGESLQKRLSEHGPLRVEEILRIGHQIAAGLFAAHQKGLVHRDIKPANILLEGDTERVTITDFGLARAVDDVSLTRDGVIAGTPQYMSPEQSNAEVVDQRSDLFSLGSVLYSLCTGRPPFRSQTSYGLIREVNETDPTPIRELNPSIPHWLCTLVSRLQSKGKSERFRDADEVRKLLESCLKHVEQPDSVPLPQVLLPDHATRVQTWAPPAFVTLLAIASLLAAAIISYQLFPADSRQSKSGQASLDNRDLSDRQFERGLNATEISAKQSLSNRNALEKARESLRNVGGASNNGNATGHDSLESDANLTHASVAPTPDLLRSDTEANPAGAEPLGYGYARLSGHIYFNGRRIDQAGRAERHRLKWSLDRELKIQNVALSDLDGWTSAKEPKLANDIDAETFMPLSEEHAKDRHNAYYKCTSYGQFWIIELPKADPASFEHVSVDLAKDKFQVWWKDKANRQINRGKLRVVKPGVMWADNRGVWQGLLRNDSAKTPQTFVHLRDKYYRDDEHVYWHDRVLGQADAATFQVLGEGFALDKNAVWHNGLRRQRLDPNSFELIHELVSRDDNCVFIRNRPIAGASSKSMRKVAVLDDNHSALLADDRSYYVYLSDWNDVYQVSHDEDSLSVSHELWNDADSKTVTAIRLTKRGWSWDDYDGPPQYKHHESQVLRGNTRQFRKAWEVISGTPQEISERAATQDVSRVVDLPRHDYPITKIYWSSDGSKLATVTEGGPIRVFRAQDGALLSLTDVEPMFEPNVSMTNDLRLVAMMEPSAITSILRIPDGRRLPFLNSETRSTAFSTFPVRIRETAFAPDGRKLAVAGVSRDSNGVPGRAATIWDVESGKLLFRSEPFANRVQILSWNADGALLAVGTNDGSGEGGRPGQVRILGLANDNVRIHQSLRKGIDVSRPKSARRLRIDAIEFTTDRKYVVATFRAIYEGKRHERAVKIWNLESGESEFDHSSAAASAVEPKLTVAKRLVAWHDGDLVRIHDRVTMRELMILRSPQKNETCSVSPTNGRIAVATVQGTVQIRELPRVE